MGREFPGGLTFQGKFYTGGICQDSYKTFFLFVLLSLCRLNFAFGDIKGKYLPGWKCLEYLSIGGGTFHGRNFVWVSFHRINSQREFYARTPFYWGRIICEKNFPWISGIVLKRSKI